jgi:hypothetical protein
MSTVWGKAAKKKSKIEEHEAPKFEKLSDRTKRQGWKMGIWGIPASIGRRLFGLRLSID